MRQGLKFLNVTLIGGVLPLALGLLSLGLVAILRAETPAADASPATAPAGSTAPAASTDPAKTAPGEPSSTDKPVASDSLATDEAKLAARYGDLEKKFLLLAKVLEQTDPRRAKLLQEAFKQSTDRGLKSRLNEIEGLLKQDRLGDASKSQQDMDQELAKLLDLLLSGDRSKQVENEKARIRNYIARINGIIKDQRGVQNRTAGEGDTKELAKKQDNLAEKAAELAKDIQNTEGVNTDAKPDDGKTPDGKTPKTPDGKSPDGKSPDDKKPDSKSPDGKTPDGKSPPKSSDSKSPNDKAPGDKSPDDKNPDANKPDVKNPDSKSPDSKSPDDKKPDDKSPAAKPDGKNPDAKPADSKSPDAKPADSKSPDAKPADGQSPDDKKPDGKPSDSKSPPQSNPHEQPMPDGGDPQAGDDDNKPDPKEPQDDTPGRKRIREAEQKMRQAQKNLEDAKRKESVEEQEHAIQKLEQAKAELEKILRQLREEQTERTLAALESRFRKMLQMQNDVYDGTVAIDKVPADMRDRHDEEIATSRLSEKEKLISIEAEKALALLHQEGSAVAFPEAVDEMREDMDQVAERLSRTNSGAVTQGVEKDVISALEEMIASLQQAQKDQKKKKPQPPMPGQSGEEQDPPLVDQLAELKVIRALQMRVNTRHERYSKLVEGEQADKPELLDALQKLSEREERIHRTTRDIVLGRNQ